MADIHYYDRDTGAYTSFAGADAIVMFEGAYIANIQSITLHTTREVVPLYILGSADPIAFNRNKRGLAGSMVMLNFDRAMLLDTLKTRALNSKYRKRVQDGILRPAGNVPWGYTNTKAGRQYVEDILNRNDGALEAFYALNSSVLEFQSLVQAQFYQDPKTFGFRKTPITMEDQLPPFDISIYMANPDGATAHMAIRGCIILNTAFGLSVDDAVSERAVTFVARRFEDLQPGLHDGGRSQYDELSQGYENPSLEDDPYAYMATQFGDLESIEGEWRNLSALNVESTTGRYGQE